MAKDFLGKSARFYSLGTRKRIPQHNISLDSGLLSVVIFFCHGFHMFFRGQMTWQYLRNTRCLLTENQNSPVWEMGTAFITRNWRNTVSSSQTHFQPIWSSKGPLTVHCSPGGRYTALFGKVTQWSHSTVAVPLFSLPQTTGPISKHE